MAASTKSMISAFEQMRKETGPSFKPVEFVGAPFKSDKELANAETEYLKRLFTPEFSVFIIDSDNCLMSEALINDITNRALARKRHIHFDSKIILDHNDLTLDDLTYDDFCKAFSKFHHQLIQQIIASTKTSAKVIIISGSNRHTRFADMFNAIEKRSDHCPLNWSSTLTLKLFCDFLRDSSELKNIELDYFWLEDIQNSQVEGTHFREMTQDPKLLLPTTQNLQAKNQAGDPWMQAYGNTPLDPNKILLLYMLRWRLSTQYPDAYMNYHFYDDDGCQTILPALIGFELQCPQAIPALATTSYYRYEPDSVDFSQKQLLPIFTGLRSFDRSQAKASYIAIYKEMTQHFPPRQKSPDYANFIKLACPEMPEDQINTITTLLKTPLQLIKNSRPDLLLGIVGNLCFYSGARNAAALCDIIEQCIVERDMQMLLTTVHYARETVIALFKREGDGSTASAMKNIATRYAFPAGIALAYVSELCSVYTKERPVAFGLGSIHEDATYTPAQQAAAKAVLITMLCQALPETQVSPIYRCWVALGETVVDYNNEHIATINASADLKRLVLAYLKLFEAMPDINLRKLRGISSHVNSPTMTGVTRFISGLIPSASIERAETQMSAMSTSSLVVLPPVPSTVCTGAGLFSSLTPTSASSGPIASSSTQPIASQSFSAQ